MLAARADAEVDRPDSPAGPDAPRPVSESPTVTRARFLMGARLVIEAAGPDAVSAIESAFGEVERLDKVLSNWRDDSELAALNREAAAHPVTCSPDLCAVIGEALRWAEMSGGAFDPTVEPLVRQLGLRGAEGRLPGVTSAMGATGKAAGLSPAGETMPAEPPGRGAWGWRHVRFDPARRLIRFDAPGVGIDLGGIGKGYALDAALRVLVARGVETALLDFSGQILVHGRGPDEGGWRIGVTGPDDRDRSRESVLIPSGSLASSGNGERSVTGPNGPVGHILDPKTGAPAVFAGTVTVLAQDGVTADALSTALFVMGPERGTGWAEEHHLDVVYLWRGPRGEPARSGAGRFAAGGGGTTP
jgi:thiamine biosynthesis lipoprotein